MYKNCLMLANWLRFLTFLPVCKHIKAVRMLRLLLFCKRIKFVRLLATAAVFVTLLSAFLLLQECLLIPGIDLKADVSTYLPRYSKERSDGDFLDVRWASMKSRLAPSVRCPVSAASRACITTVASPLPLSRRLQPLPPQPPLRQRSLVPSRVLRRRASTYSRSRLERWDALDAREEWPLWEEPFCANDRFSCSKESTRSVGNFLFRETRVTY